MFTFNKGAVCFQIELFDEAMLSIILVVLSLSRSHTILKIFLRNLVYFFTQRNPIPNVRFIRKSKGYSKADDILARG